MAGEWPPGLKPSLTADGKVSPEDLWPGAGKHLSLFLRFLVFYNTPGVFPFAQNPTVFLAVYDVAFGPLSLAPPHCCPHHQPRGQASALTCGPSLLESWSARGHHLRGVMEKKNGGDEGKITG